MKTHDIQNKVFTTDTLKYSGEEEEYASELLITLHPLLLSNLFDVDDFLRKETRSELLLIPSSVRTLFCI